MSNIVYIGASLDGYISAPDGGLDWLSYVPIPEGDDLGFSEFMDRVDVVLWGEKRLKLCSTSERAGIIQNLA